MKKNKPILQNDFKDCGVCCMQYLIIYYDGYVSLEKLREDTYTDNKGTNAYHIVNAFIKWGFDAAGVKENNLQKDNLIYPAIAHVHLKNGLEHFVVIKKIIKDTIYIMDPGIGDKKMKISEFMDIYTGHLIIVKPRSKIIKMDKSLSMSNLFWSILNEEKSLVFKIILVSITLTIVSIVCSYYLKIGSNILSSNSDYLKFLMIVFLVIYIVKVLFTYIREYYLLYLNNLVDVIVFPKFLHHIFYLPFKSIKSRCTGELVTRINDLNNIKSLFSEIFVTGFLDSLMMLSSTIILYTISPKLLGILLIFIIVYFIYSYIISKIIYRKVLENINYQTEFNSLITEDINNLESIKNLNLMDLCLFKIEKVLSRYLLNSYKFNNLFNFFNFLKNFIFEITLFIINSYGLWSVLNGSLEIIDLFTFDLILSYFINPVENITSLLPKYNFIKASFNKLADFINIKEEKIMNKGKKILNGEITFKNVSYSYNNYDYVLNDFNLQISKGMHILLNGKSGSGKSTICKIIHKELTPSLGEVLIDGINIKDLELGIIRDNILYVSQKEELFTATIKENIIMNRDIDYDYFLKICQICEIEDIVKKKSLRYDALIENSALNLSGGERQRIILARGLLKQASIIILDEALSEVDKHLEEKIIKSICEFFKDKTIIYISHKNQKKNFTNIVEV